MNIVCMDKSKPSQEAIIAKANKCYRCDNCTFIVLENQPGFVKIMCDKIPGRFLYVPIKDLNLTF